MSADSINSDDWNSCLTGSQINAWSLEDDISRIGSKAEDLISGIWGAESRVLETNSSRWKARSVSDSSDPLRRYQTPPPPDRKSPTPIADLYSQSIYQAEVGSDSWQASESCDCIPQTDDEESGSPIMKEVECMPQDLFSFSQPEAENTVEPEPEASQTAVAESSLETLNRSLTEPQENLIVEEKDLPETEESSVTEEASAAEEASVTAEPLFTEKSFTTEESLITEEDKSEYAPKLIVDTTAEESDCSTKSSLLSLSVGMSICGVGLVFGAQIMHNTVVVNPGKSLIIAGVIGLAVSLVLQSVNLLGRRKVA